jgi:hypothetical protein
MLSGAAINNSTTAIASSTQKTITAVPGSRTRAVYL